MKLTRRPRSEERGAVAEVDDRRFAADWHHATEAISMTDSQSKIDDSPGQASGIEGKSLHITMFKMLLAFVFVAVAAAAPNSSAPTATPIFDDGVPTNAPVPGNYTGALRPQIHFSPPQNFMNDPNGCHRDSNGTYHLYYQCESNTNSSFYLDYFIQAIRSIQKSCILQ